MHIPLWRGRAGWLFCMNQRAAIVLKRDFSCRLSDAASPLRVTNPRQCQNCFPSSHVQSNPKVVGVKIPPRCVTGWFRFAPQAPATRHQPRPGSAGQIPRQLPSAIPTINAAALGWLPQAPSAAEDPLQASPQWFRMPRPLRSACDIARCIQPGGGRASPCDASHSSPFPPWGGTGQSPRGAP